MASEEEQVAFGFQPCGEASADAEVVAGLDAERSADGCNCISWVNEGLAKQNCGLVTTLFRTPEAVTVGTYKLDGKKRGKPPLLLATFCPFCGTKYPERVPLASRFEVSQ